MNTEYTPEYIAIYCEYDINGIFDSKTIIELDPDSDLSVDERVLQYVSERSGVTKDELEENCLYSWEYVSFDKI